MPKRKIFYAVIIAAFLAVLAYLGFRTLEHEVLLRDYQARSLASAQASRVNTFITGILQQKATRLDAISDFLTSEAPEAVKELEEKDSDIEAAFILRKNRLLYPDESQPLTLKEQEWARTLMPLVHDPSLLLSHNMHSEQAMPQSGWFITNETSNPLLIYWRQNGASIIGFRLSYVHLMMDVANGVEAGPEALAVTENGRPLYQSAAAAQGGQALIYSQTLSWPLTAWQIQVYGHAAAPWKIYLVGSAMILLLLAAAGLLIFSLYRQYTRSTRLARQQVDFVSQVSHELKTPLTNITMYAELVREGLDDEQQQEQRYMDIITLEGQRLSRLIQNILTFTRMPTLRLQQVDIGALVSEIAHIFTPSCQAKGIVIHLHCEAALCVVSDRDSITQIVSNFLSNAEKYAARGQRIDIRAAATPQGVEIQVRDYGPGIGEKERKMIFRPFYRVQSAINEGVSGTGIGLTIAWQLAQRLQGDITVEAANPGCRFTLRLPAVRTSCEGEDNENTGR
ncbi:sensor histidine kinase [Entomohabitans teleogrylli]|uniref:sensor histidine kinase n=1 Tax=Entomohabitans teleogrylli TaxID=1384589 RepID=UPI00073D320C|nr:HAMP domain-containing sensor histidine kinase [Entomohabitans teleogrylli]